MYSTISVEILPSSYPKQLYKITTTTVDPTSHTSHSHGALARYSELRRLKDSLPARLTDFPQKLLFTPTQEELESRRKQIENWLSALLIVMPDELETFMKQQQMKYTSDGQKKAKKRLTPTIK